MTIRDIVNACLSALEMGSDSVIFTMPKVIKTFPRGELLCIQQDGTRIVSYDVMKVLGYLKRHKLISVEKLEGNKLEVSILIKEGE